MTSSLPGARATNTGWSESKKFRQPVADRSLSCVRKARTSGRSDGPIRLEVGAGILERWRSRNAVVFRLRAQSLVYPADALRTFVLIHSLISAVNASGLLNRSHTRPVANGPPLKATRFTS